MDTFNWNGAAGLPPLDGDDNRWGALPPRLADRLDTSQPKAAPFFRGAWLDGEHCHWCRRLKYEYGRLTQADMDAWNALADALEALPTLSEQYALFEQHECARHRARREAFQAVSDAITLMLYEDGLTSANVSSFYHKGYLGDYLPPSQRR